MKSFRKPMETAPLDALAWFDECLGHEPTWSWITGIAGHSCERIDMLRWAGVLCIRYIYTFTVAVGCRRNGALAMGLYFAVCWLDPPRPVDEPTLAFRLGLGPGAA